MNAKPEMVYAALTTPIGLNSWFAKEGAVATRVGDTHEFIYLVEGAKRSLKLLIEELELNKKVKWRYTEHKISVWINSTVTFSIGEEGTLSFLHEEIDERFKDDPELEKLSSTWNYILNNLKQFCETGEAHPW